MQNASSAGRKLTNEERVEVVKRQKKRNSFQLAMLSVIGILGFLLLWQAAVLAGVLPSRYVPAPTEVIALFATKLVDPNPDGAVLGVHIMGQPPGGPDGFSAGNCHRNSSGAFYGLVPGIRQIYAAHL